MRRYVLDIVLLCGLLLPTYAQTTSPNVPLPYQNQKQEIFNGQQYGTYSPISVPNTVFQSTASGMGEYTIPIAVQDLSNVGVAVEPTTKSRLYGPPIKDGNEEGPDLPGIVDPTPIGDGIWFLLACAVMMVAFRTWQLRQQRKCV